MAPADGQQRKYLSESCQRAAIREKWEETGYRTRKLPVTLRTRCAPNAVETEPTPNQPRKFEQVIEPLMLTHRLIPNAGINLICWFVGATGKGSSAIHFRGCLEALHYQQD